MDRKPLVQNSGQVQQLQAGDDLKLPLEERFRRLRFNFRLLLWFMTANGFDLPTALIAEAEQLGEDELWT